MADGGMINVHQYNSSGTNAKLMSQTFSPKPLCSTNIISDFPTETKAQNFTYVAHQNRQRVLLKSDDLVLERYIQE